MDEYIEELFLSDREEKNKLAAFLNKHHLGYEEDIQSAFGAFDHTGRLVGCGCCAGKLLKCFAVEEELRGQNIMGKLISRLTEERFSKGEYHLFVVTRPQNQASFMACGFYPLAETGSVLLLENLKDGLTRFYKKLVLPEAPIKSSSPSGEVGCVVMNCNPFTKGHLGLITYAAAQCRVLYVFVVEEDRSAFPFSVRIRLVREGCAHLSNVVVLPSGPYMISSATFPTYFLKNGEDAARVQSELDVTLFAQKIAPIFGISKRFVGEEPMDPTTRKYNEVMREVLGKYHISFVQMERVPVPNGEGVISASRVRGLLQRDGVTQEVLDLVPESTARYLKEQFQGGKREPRSGND